MSYLHSKKLSVRNDMVLIEFVDIQIANVGERT